jgi:hypothetical protein
MTKQLELYSNAIVAFIVFQGLAFCYTFGTNDRFNSTLKANISLSVGLAVLFLIIMVLALFANHFLGEKLKTLSGEYGQLVKALYLGKAVVIGFFGALPLIVTTRYAIFSA